MNKKEIFGIIGGIVVYGVYSAIKEKREADKWAKNQKMIDEMRESFMTRVIKDRNDLHRYFGVWA